MVSDWSHFIHSGVKIEYGSIIAPRGRAEFPKNPILLHTVA